MNWRIEFAPAVVQDIAEAADWYESRQPGFARLVNHEQTFRHARHLPD